MGNDQFNRQATMVRRQTPTRRTVTLPEASLRKYFKAGFFFEVHVMSVIGEGACANGNWSGNAAMWNLRSVGTFEFFHWRSVRKRGRRGSDKHTAAGELA